MKQPSEKNKEMQDRREKVALLLETKTEIEIAQIVGKSRETVVRDVQAIKKSLDKWINDLPRYSFIYKYKLALERSTGRRTILEDMFTKSTDIFEKLSISREIRNEEMFGMDLVGKAPTVYGLKRAVSGGNVQAS